MGIIVTLAIKDLKLLMRDRMALFWSAAFPLMFALFFGSIFGGESGSKGKISLVIVDQAQSSDSKSFVERLSNSESLDVDFVSGLQAAESLVSQGKRVAYLRIRAEFSGSVFELMGGGSGDDTSEATLELGVDPTRSAERGMLVGLVSQSLFSGLGAQFSDPTVMAKQVETAKGSLASARGLEPEQKQALLGLFDALEEFSAQADTTGMQADSGLSAGLGEGLIETKEVGVDTRGKPRSPFQITFPSAMIWGLMGVATTFATSLVRERTAGTLLRLQVAPMRRSQLLAGKGLACFLAGLGICAFLLSVGVIALGVEIGNVGLLLIALPCAAACFTGLMMVLAVLGKTEAAVAGSSWALMMPMAMLGGGMIPLIAMPQWMLCASSVSPFKWAIFAIEGAIWRDLTISQLALPLAILLGLAALLYAVGVAIFHRHAN
ncbi:MAG: ABC transporter permease [Nannocystaceae bacterium]|nr:ABC transporter permease [Nannocystaceae bacterium]